MIHDIPTSMASPTVVCLALLAILYLHSRLRWKARARGRPLPPGPAGLPFIGNLLDMPKSRAYYGFRDLCEKYGNVLAMRVLGRYVIVFGSPDVAFEFLDKHSSNTSDRVRTPSLELTGHSWNWGLWMYGPPWRHHRRVFWQYFNPKAIARYQPVQRATAHKFLVKLLDTPFQLVENIQFTFSASILSIAYGIDADPHEDETLAVIQKGVEGTRQILVAGGFLVDYLPILRFWPSWLPGGGFQKRFSQWRESTARLVEAPFERYMNMRDKHPQCIVADMIANQKTDPKASMFDLHTLARDMGGVIFEAGSDTTMISLQTFFVAMTLYPEVQKKAQAELDAVVGRDGLVNFSHRDSLVYVNALIKEVLRWINVAPLGLSHSTTEDDEVQGYFVPAGSILMVNVWACMHDSTVYDEPDEFRPERFIKDRRLDPDIRDPHDFVFGFGRRICPGRHYGDAALFINIASVLQVFNITPPVDENGKEITIVPTILDGFVGMPEDCRCTIKPRAPWAEALIADLERERSV